MTLEAAYREKELEQGLVDHLQDLLRHPEDQPTIGILLCKTRNRVKVENALRRCTSPIGASSYETKIIKNLPKNLQSKLPTVEEIKAELSTIKPESSLPNKIKKKLNNSEFMNKKIITIILSIYSLCGYASNEPTKQAHKPPILTTGAIIEVYEGEQFKGIVLIERGKAPFGKAIPGGKVEYGETVEHAVRREMQEEVGLELHDLKQFHVYSDPSRDFRHHSVEVTHVAKAFQLPTAGDDAAQAFLVRLEDIPWEELAFDHSQILKDYMHWKAGNTNLSMTNP